MKRLAVFVVAMLMMLTSLAAYAEGVFVPTYKTFMEKLCEYAPAEYAELIRLGYLKDGEWHENYTTSYNLVGKNMFQTYRDVKNGFVYKFEVSLSEEAYQTYKADYDALITAVMLAVREDYTDESVAAMKANLLIETITVTPVEYMYQSVNDGVYRYGFLKRNGTFTFSIEFALT